MRILVTGANGFVGKYLVSFLKKSEISYIAPNSSVLNITSKQSIRNFLTNCPKFERVINLAAMSNRNIENQNIWEVNYNGVRNLVECLHDVDWHGRFMQVSSSEVYGYSRHEEAEFDESSEIKPENIYGRSKAEAEHFLTGFGDLSPISIQILRPFNHTGPNQREEFLIPKLVSATACGNAKPLILRSLFDRRDYSDVRDVVDVYSQLAIQQKNSAKLLNICSGITYSVSELIDIINSLSKRFSFSPLVPELTSDGENQPTSVVRGNCKLLDSLPLRKRKYSIETTIFDMLKMVHD